jgi:MerR family transcriptional regulator, copper efflux regulator
MDELTIGSAARMAGVGVETVRFYERRDLIEQPRKPGGGGYRLYSVEIVQRICFIRQAQELGFSLKEIDELLSLRADPGSDCGEVQKRASEKLEEVERKISQLRKIGDALEDVIASCPSRGGLDGCSIIRTLENYSNETASKPAK